MAGPANNFPRALRGWLSLIYGLLTPFPLEMRRTVRSGVTETQLLVGVRCPACYSAGLSLLALILICSMDSGKQLNYHRLVNNLDAVTIRKPDPKLIYRSCI